MTAIPPVGANMPPVVADVAPAAPGAPAATEHLQALLGSLDQSQFFSGPELLGALGAQGNATLRDFLGRLKKTASDIKSTEIGKSDAEAEAGVHLHGGPAREPFEREGGPQKPASEIANLMIQRAQELAEHEEVMAEAAVAGKIVTTTARAVGELIKGQ